MKKLISALSSVVIAATAMGGSLSLSTDAASVSETIVSLRSNGKSEIQVNAGDKVPVTVYIPQSSGFNSLMLKFAIGKDGNLKDTLGQGSIVDRKGKVTENYKDAFGNYNIKLVPTGDDIEGDPTDFSYPNCLESGAISEFALDAGDVVNTGIAMFNAEAWSILFQAKAEINAGKCVDAYGAWVAAGGNDDFDYSSYTPAYTWSKDESWAYEYSFAKFELELPADMADGVYTLDVYKDEYVNTHPSSLYSDENEPFPDDKRGMAQSNFNSPDGKQPYSSEKLTIIVGDGKTTTEAPKTTTEAPKTTTEAPKTTTEAPKTTTEAPKTTTEAPKTTTGAPKTTMTAPPENAIIYNLIPHGKEYESAEATGQKNNLYKATAGEELKIDWTIKNDQGTAGLQMNFDFTQVEYVSGARGTGYRIAPTYSDYKNTENLKKGEVVYTWAQSSEATKAKDGSVIYSFNVVVPEAAGTYTVGAGTGTTEVNKVVPKNQDTPHTFVFYGLDIVVPGEVETTIATAETTAAATTTKAVATTTAAATTTKAVATTTAAVTTTKAVATTTAAATTTKAVATTTAAATTTKAAATTTAALTTKPSETTAAPTTTADADAIIYNLIPHNKTYTKAAESGAKNNFYKATAGEKLRIDWTIQNDQGTAGIQMNFDFSQVEYVSGTRSTGYRISPTYSDPKNTEGLKAGEVVYTWAQSNEAAKAKDNAIIYYFTVNVPKEDGLYTVGLNDKEVNKVVPKNQETPHKFVFYGLDIQVGEVTTTPAPATTTADAATTTAADVTTTAVDATTTAALQTTTAPAVTTADTTKATETTDPADADVLYGDVNCDGAVRIGDVVLLNRYLAKNAEVTPQGLKNANCEKDDKIDSKDAVKIKKFLALLIKENELGKKSS